MDYTYIVETNEAYNEKNLKEKDKKFIEGMRYVLSNVVDFFLDNYIRKDSKSLCDKLKYEIVSEAIEELEDYIDAEICASIVSIIDGYGDDE